MSLTNIPMTNPDIVTGVSLSLLFVFVGSRMLGQKESLTFWTLLIAHVTFNLPYVILNVMPKLQQMNPALEDAAMDLGCTPVQAFFKVTLHEIMPGIVDLFADTDTRIYVVLPPPVGEPASEPAAVAIRAMYRDLAAERPEVTIVDPAPLLGPDGAFHLTLPCEPWETDVCAPDGTVTVRNADGIHLAPAGGERYARVLLDAIGEPVET